MDVSYDEEDIQEQGRAFRVKDRKSNYEVNTDGDRRRWQRSKVRETKTE